jgi:hypothetical protein
MGCHTWFYRKINRTQDEAREDCLVGYRKSLNLYKKILKDPLYKRIEWGYTDEQLTYYISSLEIQIKDVENRLCEKEVWDEQSDEDLTQYVDDKGLFIEDTGYHDLFRTHIYSSPNLFSLEETLNFINDPINECRVFPSTFNLLEEFWTKYPDGMIDFG